MLVQTILSYLMQPELHSKDIFWARLAVFLWSCSSILSSILCLGTGTKTQQSPQDLHLLELNHHHRPQESLIVHPIVCPILYSSLGISGKMVNPFNTFNIPPWMLKKKKVRGTVTTLSPPPSYCTPETENRKNRSLSPRGLTEFRNMGPKGSVLKGWVVSMGGRNR